LLFTLPSPACLIYLSAKLAQNDFDKTQVVDAGNTQDFIITLLLLPPPPPPFLPFLVFNVAGVTE